MKLWFLMFVLFSFLFTTQVLHAVGGKGTTEVSEEEVVSKGIVKFHSPGVKTNNFTGVLFEGGNGQIGISAKHCFFDFNDYPFYAHLGKETQKVIKVFTNKINDIAVFVLEKPFLNISSLPKLLKSSPLFPVQTATLFGFGLTEVDNVVDTDSSLICRKGECTFAPFGEIQVDLQESVAHSSFNKGYTTQESHSNYLISIRDYGIESLDSSVLKEYDELRKKYVGKVAPENINKNLQNDVLTRSFLRNKGLLLSKNVLPFSAISGYGGDSGCPLIDKDNYIHGVFVSFKNTGILAKLKMSALAPELKNNWVKEKKFDAVQFGNNTYFATMYLHRFSGITMHIVERVGETPDNKNGSCCYKVRPLEGEKSEVALNICYKFFATEMVSCLDGSHDREGSNTFIDRLQKEKEFREEDRILTSLCAQFRPWSMNIFVSTLALKDWIGRATDAAFLFLERERTKRK